ncbi:hypothetical protein Tco_1449059 [Tanacetum coccineum]
MAASIEALIVEFASTPTPPSPPPSPLSPWSSPLLQIPSPPLHVLSPPLPLPSLPTHTSPTDDDAPLGYRAKRARFSALASRFEVGESLATATARQAGHALTSSVDYGFIDIAQIPALQRDVKVLQRQRINDGDRLMSHILHKHDRFRELVRTRYAGPQDGPADAGRVKIPPKRTTTTTPMTDVAIKALIARGVADALAEFNVAEGVNAASEEVSTVELVSTAYEVIENGATLPKIAVVEGVEKVMPITSVEDKAQRRLEVKARKMLDQTFDRIQKLVSQLELLDEKLSQEDVNQKLLRSLSPEWNTHVVVWRNKADFDTMSIDDLYNNLKVYEPEVKGMSSSSTNTQNIAFMSSSNNNTNSSNEVVNAAHGVTTTST